MRVFVFRQIAALLVCALLQMSTVAETSAFTVGEEREMGEKLFYQIRLAFPLVDDPDVSQYLNDLGTEVLDVAGVQYFDYHFHVIESTQFNAFAAPSGLIFFYSGLIEQMQHENELVSVLAHEIGHVVSRHIAAGMDKNMKLTVATSLLALASIALGAGAVSQALLTGSLAAGQAASLHFSREAEEEADRLAYGWMKKMKRHPEGQENMLRAMRRISRYSMGDNIPQYLLTHPNPAARLDYIQSLMDFEHNELSALRKNDDFAFLRMKYRLLTMVKDGKQLRNLLMSYVQDDSRPESERIMAKYGLSQLDRLENNFASSRELLKEVAAFYPDRSILKVDQGLLELQDGYKDRALALVSSAYEQNRHDLWAVWQLGRVWFELGNLEKAERYFKELQTAMPSYSKLYFEMGRLESQRGKNAEASYYLAQFYLYEGKLVLARKSVAAAEKDKGLSAERKDDIKKLLDLIDRLEKKN